MKANYIKWISELYSKDILQENSNVQGFTYNKINNKHILEFANNKFGKFAGLAQQYLFFWRRENWKISFFM